jgi:zinc protease
MKTTRFLTATAVALALAGCASTQRAEAPKAAAAAVPADAWAHGSSDLQPDSNVRFGTLPNGMRYAIMKNATPPGEASLRLRIDAGSLNEAEDQRGLAHFLEHMVLNGTKNVPEGEFVRRLERHGLKFGPDTNAYTSFDETVYMLDLPETDAETVDTALFLLREVAGEATLDPKAIDAERGIILSEERTRATPQLRVFIDEIGYMVKDDLLAQRLPIGQTEIIRTAPRERLARFYEGYYRPERATLIATGDFDVAAMETKILNLFGNWQGKGAPAADPAPPKLGDRDTEARVYVEAGAPTRASISWVSPPDLRPDTRARRLERLVEQLGLRIVNRRLERLATSAAPPFIGAGAQRNEQAGRAEVVQMIAVAQAGQWQPALAAIEQEQRRAVKHGFTQAELDREIAELRAALTAAAAGAATRPSAQLAQGLVGAVNDDEVFTTPAANLALFEEGVKGLTADRVAEATRGLFKGEGPLVYLTSPTPVDKGEQAVLAAYEGSRGKEVAAPEVQQAKAWPYESFGAPGAVAERRELPGLDATAVRFANGVRLTVKPTKFKNDEILVGVRFGNGMMAMSRPSLALAIPMGFPAGGLGQLTYEEMEQVLTGTVYGVDAGVGEDAFQLQGRTRPQDFARQMQVLAAYAKDPGWRPTGWDRLRAISGTIHDQLESTPGGVFNRDAAGLLHAGDGRWAFPSREEIAASSIGDAKKLLGPALASGPMEVIVVGDISVDEAIRQTAATFGTLPPRKPMPVPAAAAQTRFPAPAGIVRLSHGGRADQGLAFIAWPTTGFYADQKRTRTLNLLAQVLQLRLTEEIREKQATTYSPNAGHAPSEAFAGYGYLSAQIEAPPERLEGFLADAAKIARDLAERPIDADEINRARRPLVENIQRQRAANQWWLSELATVQERPEAAESIRLGLAQYASITAADLQQAARQYLLPAKAYKLVVTPKAK